MDRTGEHHLWLGAKNPQRGTGRVEVAGRQMTAHRLAWELAHGPLPDTSRVLGCPEEPACVRLDHLQVTGDETPESRSRGVRASERTRSRKGGGSMREIRPGVWKFTVTVGQYDDGKPRRIYRQVFVPNANTATRELAAFVAEARSEPPVVRSDRRALTFDAAVELYLDQYLRGEKGRDERTIEDYTKIHRRWFSPYAGGLLLREVNEGTLDHLFGRMRKAGLSRSSLNHAKSLYSPLFKWALRRGMVTRNPMVSFQLPTSAYVSKERVPPEAEELSLLLQEAVQIIPDAAPLLALGAVTGMRRGELVGLRRSRIRWAERRLEVDTAIDHVGRIKGTKTRKERFVDIDDETVALLRRQCDLMDERAAALGFEVGPDGFVFSLAADCAQPMPPDFLTKRVGELKDHLGIADTKPETIALQTQALKLYRRKPRARRPGARGLAPKGGMSLAEIGERLGRSERWAMLAIRAAERREAAKERGLSLNFDGSIIALRKFTSSELLDAGFNISVVAQRQGHGPQVLVQHYSKRRRSAERKAAEHLGSVVHGKPAAVVPQTTPLTQD